MGRSIALFSLRETAIVHLVSSPAQLVKPGQSAEALSRSLNALPELEMRIRALRSRVNSNNLLAWAPTFEELLQSSLSTDAKARRAVLPLCLYLSQEYEAPLLQELKLVAQGDQLWNLERALASEEQRPETPESVDAPIADPLKGREISVGERRSMARRPTRREIERLLFDPHPLVLNQLFNGPSITEEDILRVVTKRPARNIALQLLIKKTRWMARSRIRSALVLNPGCPRGISLPLLYTLKREELTSIVQASTLADNLRAAALQIKSKLPPTALSSPSMH